MTDIDYMKLALQQAEQAYEAHEVPVGAVAVFEGKVIAKAYNQMRMLKDPTAHAEIIAITQAAAALKSERLIDVDLYVTVEPCSMCAGAMVWARIRRIIYGAPDKKAGACGSVLNVAHHKQLNHRVEITGGVLEEECAFLITDFFRVKRARDSELNN